MARRKCARELVHTFGLRCATYSDARKVTTTGPEFYAEFELRTRLAFDKCLRPSTSRRPRPSRTRLETRSATGRSRAAIDFIRRRALKRRVRTVGMIPVHIELQ